MAEEEKELTEVEKALLAEQEAAKEAELKSGIADSGWDQAFLITFLESFIGADRIPSKMKQGFATGNYVHIKGTIDDVISASDDASRDVDALALLNSAQLSSLVPYVRIIRVPSAALLATDPEAKPQPMHFHLFEDVDRYSTTGNIIPDEKGYHDVASRGVGIKDIDMTLDMADTTKWGPPKTNVKLTLEFDSMKTFVANQRGGVSFLDLIPTASSTIKTGGNADVLYELKLIVGWSKPSDGAATLFTDPESQQALQRIDDMKIAVQLTYPVRHNFEFNNAGGVTLTLEYKPFAADLQGIESQQRSDILPPPPPGSKLASAYADERKKIQAELELARIDQQKALQGMNAAKSEYHKALLRDADEHKKLRRALDRFKREEVLYGLGSVFMDDFVPPEKVFTSFEQYAASTKGRVDPEVPDYETTLDNSEAAQAALDEYYDSHDQELFTAKKAAEKKYGVHEDASNDAYNKIERYQSKLEDLKEDMFILESKYSAFIKTLHQKGQLHYVDVKREHYKEYSRKWYKYVPKLQDQLASPMMKMLQVEASGVSREALEAYFVEKNTKMMEDITKGLPSTSARQSKPYNKRILQKKAKRVYYFYLGDLLGMAMDFYYANSTAPESANDDPGNKASRFHRHSLMLGDFYFHKYKDKKKKKIRYHMGDFPIALPTFTKFFTERYVRRGVTAISLEEFLKDVVHYLFGPSSEINKRMSTEKKEKPMLNQGKTHKENRWLLKFAKVQSPTRFERGRAQQKIPGGFYDLDPVDPSEWRDAAKLWASKKHKESMKGLEELKKLEAETQKTLSILGTSDLLPGQKIYTYYMIGPAENRGSNKALFTLWAGTDTSIIKNMKFDQSGGGSKRVKQARIADQAGDAGSSMKAKIFNPSTAYTVNLECIGAPFFKPGQVFMFDAGIFGLAGLSLEGTNESLDDILPKYLIVDEVNHKISDVGFSTSVKCRVSTQFEKDVKWEDSGFVEDFVVTAEMGNAVEKALLKESLS